MVDDDRALCDMLSMPFRTHVDSQIVIGQRQHEKGCQSIAVFGRPRVLVAAQRVRKGCESWATWRRWRDLIECDGSLAGNRAHTSGSYNPNPKSVPIPFQIVNLQVHN